MSSDEPHTPREELQFDRVETGALPAGQTTGGLNVVCEMCGKAIGSEYFTVNDKPVCASCRDILLEAARTPRSIGPLVRAGLFGLGAAIAGAAIYYAVIAITNFEIGLVAILIGYMVGWGVRRGARGRGGRRFQILALVLTYWAVGLAYTPLAFKQLTGNDTSAQTPADSTRANLEATDSASSDTLNTIPMTGSKVLLGLGLGLVFVFALPIMSIVGSMPSGLLSALIIGFGLHQAWSMTRARKLAVSGPFKVGSGPTTEPELPPTT